MSRAAQAAQRENFKLFMEIFDPMQKGYITLKSVETTLIANGFLEEKPAVIGLLKYLEPDKNERIEVADIEPLLAPAFIDLEANENIEDMFDLFDKDEDEYISSSDLIDTSESLGFQLGHRHAKMMIDEYDSNHDGKVTLEDFYTIFDN